VAGVDVLVMFESAHWDNPAAMYQPSQGYITIINAGYYYVTANVMSCHYDSKRATVKVNGQEVIVFVYSTRSSPSSQSIAAADIIKLMPGDTVGLYVTSVSSNCVMNAGIGTFLLTLAVFLLALSKLCDSSSSSYT
jgi:hypothetical protein